MMNDILKKIKAGEVSGVQFKERILDKYDIACELVAFRMFLFNNAIYLLPYTGVGSGITRALDEDINVTFMNNDKAQEFVITVWRGESNQVQDSDTRLRHSDTKKVSLSNKQRDIVNFCSVPRTTAEIMERLGLSNQTKNRERYITSLVAAGYLQMTNPENPTASNQKYKKVTTK